MDHHAETLHCRSIFKDGGNVSTPETFTKAWITMINQIEKNKGFVIGIR